MAKTSRRRFLAVAGAAAFSTGAPGSQPGDVIRRAESPSLQCLPYTQHLAPEEVERIRKDFADAVPYLESFRKFRLANADEPDFTFHSLTERW